MDSQDYAYYANILQDEPLTSQTTQAHVHIPGETESTTKKASQRTRNFTVEEDNLLVSAWLNISIDAVQGNEQNRGKYWERITEYFHKYKNFNSDRSSNSLMNRWSTIQLSVNKFCGFYAQIEMRNQSGANEQDKIFQAKQMYQSIQKSAFQYLHCWNELRYQPKWIEDSQKKKSRKVKNTSPSPSLPSTPDSINLEDDDDASDAFVNIERPLGRKASKELLRKRKNKECVNDGTSKSLAVILEEFKEEKKEMDRKRYDLLERTYVQEEERLLLEKEKVQVEKEKMLMKNEKVRIENEKVLMENEKVRLESLKEEERIMLMDTSCMPPHLATYYNRRQMEIMAKKS